MGCLSDQMPQDCRIFVDQLHEFTTATNKMFFSFPFHKLWRTKKWRSLVNSMNGIYNYCKGHVDKKIKEIEECSETSANGNGNQAELGMDFLTYMIYSGQLSVEDISVDAIDMLTAGVDTVRAVLYQLK